MMLMRLFAADLLFFLSLVANSAKASDNNVTESPVSHSEAPGQLNLTAENLEFLDNFHRMVTAAKIFESLGISKEAITNNFMPGVAGNSNFFDQLQKHMERSRLQAESVKTYYIHSRPDFLIRHNSADRTCHVTLTFNASGIDMNGEIEQLSIFVPRHVVAKMTTHEAALKSPWIGEEMEKISFAAGPEDPKPSPGSIYISAPVTAPNDTQLTDSLSMTLRIKVKSQDINEILQTLRQSPSILLIKADQQKTVQEDHVSSSGSEAEDSSRDRRELSAATQSGGLRNNRNRARNTFAPSASGGGNCQSMWDRGFLNSGSGLAGTQNLIPCCKRELEVDFDKLGWGPWIVSPRKFKTAYCIGRCAKYGSFSDTTYSLYAEIMQAYPKVLEMGKIPCCTPVSFSGITVTTRQSPREESIQTLNNIVVDKCGCL